MKLNPEKDKADLIYRKESDRKSSDCSRVKKFLFPLTIILTREKIPRLDILEPFD